MRLWHARPQLHGPPAARRNQVSAGTQEQALAGWTGWRYPDMTEQWNHVRHTDGAHLMRHAKSGKTSAAARIMSAHL